MVYNLISREYFRINQVIKKIIFVILLNIFKYYYLHMTHIEHKQMRFKRIYDIRIF